MMTAEPIPDFRKRLIKVAQDAAMGKAELGRWFGVTDTCAAYWLIGRSEPSENKARIIALLLAHLEKNAEILKGSAERKMKRERIFYARDIRNSSLSPEDLTEAKAILPLF